MNIGGNVTAGRDVIAAEGDQSVTQQGTLPPDIDKKITQVRDMLTAKEPPDASHVKTLFMEIMEHTPQAAKELYQAFKQPLELLGVFLHIR